MNKHLKNRVQLCERIVILIIIMLIANKSFCQEGSNKQRLKILPELIEEELNKENFEEVTKLKKEFELRTELDEALAEHDYVKASKIRDQIQFLDSNLDFIPDETMSYQEKREVNKRLFFYFDITPVGFSNYSYSKKVIKSIYNANGAFMNSYSELEHRIEQGYSINFKLGNKLYFNDVYNNNTLIKKFRIGLDLNYLSLNGSFIDVDLDKGEFLAIAISLLRPGILLTYNIKPMMGIDLQVNTGATVMLSRYNTLGYLMPMFVFSVNPHLKYWVKRYGFGIDYNYAKSTVNDMVLNHLGLTFSLRI